MREVREIDSELKSRNYERELEDCQRLGGDIELYRRLSFNVLQLEQIRHGLEAGVDVEKYLDPKLTWMEMESIRIQLESGVDVSKYTDQGYSWQQCTEIQIGLQEGLDVSQYDKKYYFSQQMQEIRFGLENSIDVSFYTDPDFDWMQMKEIRLGLEAGLDVAKYADKKYNYSMMRAIRRGLEKGRNYVPFADKGIDGKILLEMNRGLDIGNKEIIKYVEKGYRSAQLEQINNAYEAKVDLQPFLSAQFHGAQLQEIVKGLKKGLDVSRYAQKYYNWFQMREIRFGMEDKIDTSVYENPDFSANQMAEIRKGILAGVDVSEYAKIYFDPEQMQQKREELEVMSSAEEDEGIQRMLAEAEALEEEQRREEERRAAEKKAEEETQQEEVQEVAEEEDASKGQAEQATEKEPAENMGIIIDDFLLDACVKVAEDKMSAIINLELVASVADGLRVPDIVRSLKHFDVKQGIDRERIGKMLKNKEYNQDVVVAKGKLPENGEDGKFIYHFRRNIKKKPKMLDDGSVDFKDMNLFESVSKGQLIAEYVPATSGTFGYDILGNIMAPNRGKELPPIHGKGFEISEDRKKYTSLLSGIIDMKENGDIEISNVYVVKGNVDASTGNISFDGDIQVNGNVLAGFIVSASGNIVIDGQVEGATILSGKDVVLHKGCAGQSVGRIEADGMITGQFFESVELVSGGDIYASYFLDCNVKSEGRLFVEGRRGLILGGHICAKQGVSCRTIGNVAEVRTIIEVGVGQDELTEYQELMKQIEKVKEEILTCENALEKFMSQPERDEKTTVFCEQLTKAIYSEKKRKKELEESRKQIVQKMDAQKSARIAVSGSAYPNVRVYINSVPFRVKEVMNNVQFVKQQDNKVGTVAR